MPYMLSDASGVQGFWDWILPGSGALITQQLDNRDQATPSNLPTPRLPNVPVGPTTPSPSTLPADVTGRVREIQQETPPAEPEREAGNEPQQPSFLAENWWKLLLVAGVIGGTGFLVWKKAKG